MYGIRLQGGASAALLARACIHTSHGEAWPSRYKDKLPGPIRSNRSCLQGIYWSREFPGRSRTWHLPNP